MDARPPTGHERGDVSRQRPRRQQVGRVVGQGAAQLTRWTHTRESMRTRSAEVKSIRVARSPRG